MPKQFLLLFALPFLLISCSNIVFEQVVNIENGNWQYDQPANFEFESPDSSSRYNLILLVDHSTDFAYQNTYVKINTKFPSGKENSQQLSLNLADKTGRWNGKCSGEKCSAAIALQMNTYFDEPGKYQVEVQQDSRANPLAGIERLSLLIETVQ